MKIGARALPNLIPVSVAPALQRLSLTFLLMLSAQPTLAETLTLAVASNFGAPMQAIAKAFERERGHRVALVLGSSGKFFAQIQHGAPFDIFFSADQVKPEALEKAGLVVPGTRMTYAVGALVLWSVDSSAEQRFKQGRFQRLALANPRLAPYGVAAVEVLRHLQQEEATRARWVQGENIAQTYQFVRSANADLGFVALSQVVAAGKVDPNAWVLPLDWYRPIRQDAVLLKRGAQKMAAREFLHFMRGATAQALIQAYGYQAP